MCPCLLFIAFLAITFLYFLYLICTAFGTCVKTPTLRFGATPPSYLLPLPWTNYFLLSRIGLIIRPTKSVTADEVNRYKKTWDRADSTCSVKSICLYACFGSLALGAYFWSLKMVKKSLGGHCWWSRGDSCIEESTGYFLRSPPDLKFQWEGCSSKPHLRLQRLWAQPPSGWENTGWGFGFSASQPPFRKQSTQAREGKNSHQHGLWC